tara:strand:- start:1856 stop:2659 length:804 start_codon:yes stop_codon:yes gene_type:complete
MNYYLKKRGYIVKKLKTNLFLSIVKKIIKKHFNKTDNYYCKIPINKFHKIALNCQNELNKINLDKVFFQSEKNNLKKLFNNEGVFISKIFTLRVVRPQIKISKNKQNEHIGWHRETFYANHKYVEHAMNVWFPIINVTKKNGLKYIQNSHLISDKLIKRKKFKPKGHNIKRFSISHKLGFPYEPKKIISGVNLNNFKTMNVKKGYYNIFSQMLVHGNSSNTTNKLRFAINTGMVPKSKLLKNRIINKKKFILNNKNNSLYVLYDNYN